MCSVTVHALKLNDKGPRNYFLEFKACTVTLDVFDLSKLRLSLSYVSMTVQKMCPGMCSVTVHALKLND